jgi:hypothetical protein
MRALPPLILSKSRDTEGGWCHHLSEPHCLRDEQIDIFVVEREGSMIGKSLLALGLEKVCSAEEEG